MSLAAGIDQHRRSSTLLNRVPRVSSHCLALAVVSMIAAGAAEADVIVNTGTPNGNEQWDFDPSQYFAGEFSLVQTETITISYGYFSITQLVPENVTVAILANIGGMPGTQ